MFLISKFFTGQFSANKISKKSFYLLDHGRPRLQLLLHGMRLIWVGRLNWVAESVWTRLLWLGRHREPLAPVRVPRRRRRQLRDLMRGEGCGGGAPHGRHIARRHGRRRRRVLVRRHRRIRRPPDEEFLPLLRAQRLRPAQVGGPHGLRVVARRDYALGARNLSRPGSERRRRGMAAVLHVVRLVGAVDPVGVGRVDGTLAGGVRPLQGGQSPRPWEAEVGPRPYGIV